MSSPASTHFRLSSIKNSKASIKDLIALKPQRKKSKKAWMAYKKKCVGYIKFSTALTGESLGWKNT